MSFVMYTETDTAVLEHTDIRIYRDDSFANQLNGYPSDRYGYSLQWFSNKSNKTSQPLPMKKFLAYAKENKLNIFGQDEGVILPCCIYQNGNTAKISYSYIPLSHSVFQSLCKPETISMLKERICAWNVATDEKIKYTNLPSTGMKLDLATIIGHIETSDPSVQVSLYVLVVFRIKYINPLNIYIERDII